MRSSANAVYAEMCTAAVMKGNTASCSVRELAGVCSQNMYLLAIADGRPNNVRGRKQGDWSLLDSSQGGRRSGGQRSKRRNGTL